jgi:hypothetical protein
MFHTVKTPISWMPKLLFILDSSIPWWDLQLKDAHVNILILFEY